MTAAAVGPLRPEPRRRDAHERHVKGRSARGLPVRQRRAVVLEVLPAPTPAREIDQRRLRGAQWDKEKPYQHARAQLVGLQREHARLGLTIATQQAFGAALGVLRSVLAEDTVYPTLSIDEDGGVAAEWYAARFIIEIDCSPEGATTWSARRQGDRYVPRTSITPLRQLLREFTAVVNEQNPNWRALFRTGQPQQ